MARVAPVPPASAAFDRLLADTVRAQYPPHEHEQFIGHFRGLVGQWVREHGRAPEHISR